MYEGCIAWCVACVGCSVNGLRSVGVVVWWLRCVGDAVCGSCGVWGLWFKGIASRVVTVLGVTVWGDMLCENQNMPDLPHVGVTVCSGIAVWGLQCARFAVCGSCGVWE